MADKHSAGQEKTDQQDECMEDLFLQGSSFSPRKTDYFVNKEQDTVVKGTQNIDRNQPSSSGIKRGLSIHEDEGHEVFKRNPGDVIVNRKSSVSELLPSGIKRGLSTSEEGGYETPKRKLVDMYTDSPQSQMDFSLRSPRTASKNITVYASPRVIRTYCEDGSAEQEFQLTTPVVRHSKTLALRRVTSDVGNSPQLQIVSSGKSLFSYGNKASPLEKLMKMSEGSSSSRDSVDIETDEETTEQLDSARDDRDPMGMKQNEQDPFIQPIQSVSKEPGQVSSTAARIPFPSMLQRQKSELFERGPDVSAKDIAFLQGKEKGDNSPNEFKLGRRRSGRMEQLLTRNTKPDEKKQALSKKEWRALSNDEKRRYTSSDQEQKALPRCGRSLPIVKNREQEERIKSAVEVFSRHDSYVIADGTVPYALPCFRGKKEELMFITCHTLAEVLQGNYNHVLDHHVIIDCRYPFEYDGGHIMGALNMYKTENVGEIMSWKTEGNDKRMVLIFHCEFSSQRGPSMMRLLRSTDRKHNLDCYPHLCHPEIYLLQGGYKEFYQHYPNLCEPHGYIPMAHSAYASELKKFLARSTSWHGKDLKFSKHPHTLLI